MNTNFQAIKNLYNGLYMPYIVFLAPPPLEEFKQIYQIHPNRTKQKSVIYYKITTDNSLKNIF